MAAEDPVHSLPFPTNSCNMPTQKSRSDGFRPRFLTLVVLTVPLFVGPPSAADEVIDRSLSAIQNVGKEGAGFDKAIPAARRLRSVPVGQVHLLLDGMAGVNPIAENWLRGVVFDVVRNADFVPLDSLREYAMDSAHNPKGRGLAMELIRNESPETAEPLIAKCLNDSSLPLREMAVQQAIERAKSMEKEEGDAAKSVYREALVAARHPRQVERIIKSLDGLGDKVNTREVFAMLPTWKSLAPFDNVDGVGFDAVYAPEKEFVAKGTVDLDASYDGKKESIRWQTVEGSDDEGAVDLAAAYEKEKGAVSYLYAEFESSTARLAEVRLGCINANKVWINGKPVMANEVYHSGSMIDQYIAPFDLKAGKNRILLKVCQNEQTEPWAQDWTFQIRITDPTGKGLRSGE